MPSGIQLSANPARLVRCCLPCKQRSTTHQRIAQQQQTHLAAMLDELNCLQRSDRLLLLPVAADVVAAAGRRREAGSWACQPGDVWCWVSRSRTSKTGSAPHTAETSHRLVHSQSPPPFTPRPHHHSLPVPTTLRPAPPHLRPRLVVRAVGDSGCCALLRPPDCWRPWPARPTAAAAAYVGRVRKVGRWLRLLVTGTAASWMNQCAWRWPPDAAASQAGLHCAVLPSLYCSTLYCRPLLPHLAI